jgi:hypothetical protein
MQYADSEARDLVEDFIAGDTILNVHAVGNGNGLAPHKALNLRK